MHEKSASGPLQAWLDARAGRLATLTRRAVVVWWALSALMVASVAAQWVRLMEHARVMPVRFVWSWGDFYVGTGTCHAWSHHGIGSMLGPWAFAFLVPWWATRFETARRSGVAATSSAPYRTPAATGLSGDGGAARWRVLAAVRIHVAMALASGLLACALTEPGGFEYDTGLGGGRYWVVSGTSVLGCFVAWAIVLAHTWAASHVWAAGRERGADR